VAAAMAAQARVALAQSTYHSFADDEPVSDPSAHDDDSVAVAHEDDLDDNDNQDEEENDEAVATAVDGDDDEGDDEDSVAPTDVQMARKDVVTSPGKTLNRSVLEKASFSTPSSERKRTSAGSLKKRLPLSASSGSAIALSSNSRVIAGPYLAEDDCLDMGWHKELPVPNITDAQYRNLESLLIRFCRVPLLAEFSRPVSLLHPEVRFPPSTCRRLLVWLLV
jgi:hypothetical protein